MTKEEKKAKAYAENKWQTDVMREASFDSFLAGLKAGRPQWHTPNVPTSPINKVVLGYIKDCNSKKLCLVEWNGEWWYDANTYNDRVKVIDWCEIPTFDKE